MVMIGIIMVIVTLMNTSAWTAINSSNTISTSYAIIFIYYPVCQGFLKEAFKANASGSKVSNQCLISKITWI